MGHPVYSRKVVWNSGFTQRSESIELDSICHAARQIESNSLGKAWFYKQT